MPKINHNPNFFNLFTNGIRRLVTLMKNPDAPKTTPYNREFGVIIPPNEPEKRYIFEILTQQGLFYHELTIDDVIHNKCLPRLLLFVGKMSIAKDLTRDLLKKLRNHLETGNVVVMLGMIPALSDLSGIIFRSPETFPFPIGGYHTLSVGEGYLTIQDENLMSDLSSDYFPLHGFGCSPGKQAKPQQSKVLAIYRVTTPTMPKAEGSQIIAEDSEEDEWPAIVLNPVGDGHVLYCGVDILSSVRQIQEGRYVIEDGIPPADGMAPIDDKILKCEDGLVLDWNRDRRSLSPSEKVPAFMIPIADVWRRILRACIEKCADLGKIALYRVDYWPDAAPVIVHISHDTDGNKDNLGQKMLARVTELDIKTTWCLISPGYSPKLCETIANAGHELAFHFDAQSFNLPDIFSFETFKEQLEETKAHSRISEFYTNKNHYTRWEGKTDFFEWCVRLGIKLDESKGPSKCGTQGFPFGSCHPWQAMDKSGQLIDCLELSFQSQDIGLQGPEDTGQQLFEACKSVHGVCHFIFHPAHVENPIVQKRFSELVNYAKNHGGIFLTAREIGEWYRTRRQWILSGGAERLPHAMVMIRNPEAKSWQTG